MHSSFNSLLFFYTSYSIFWTSCKPYGSVVYLQMYESILIFHFIIWPQIFPYLMQLWHQWPTATLLNFTKFLLCVLLSITQLQSGPNMQTSAWCFHKDKRKHKYITSSLSEVLPPLTRSRPLVAPAGSNCKSSPAACYPFMLQFVSFSSTKRSKCFSWKTLFTGEEFNEGWHWLGNSQ